MRHFLVDVLAVALLLGYVPASVYAQSLSLISKRTWTAGGAGASAYGVAVDSSGNVYVTGAAQRKGSEMGGALLLKYDSSGSIKIQQIWSTTRSSEGRAVAVDSSGNVYLAGQAVKYADGRIDSDVLLLKYDSFGNLLFEKTWGGTDDEEAQAVAVDSAKNVYVTGWTQSREVLFPGSTSYMPAKIFLLKFDSSGELEFQKGWNPGASTDSFGVAVDSSGNVYVTGGITLHLSTPTEEGDVFLLKFDPSGIPIFQRTWGRARYYSQGIGIAIDSSDNLYVAGESDMTPETDIRPFGLRNRDVLLLKYDSFGNLLFQETWGGMNQERGNSVAVDSNGHVIVAGHTWGGLENENFLVLKFDASGHLLFQRTWGSTGTVTAPAYVDEGTGVATFGVDFYVVGYVSEPPPYTLLTPSGTVRSPNGTAGFPSETFPTLFGTAATAAGMTTKVIGSETFAGLIDSALLEFTETPPPALFWDIVILIPTAVLVLLAILIRRRTR